MAKIRIMFSRYSAFYSPLIATQAGGFLAAEGLDAEFSVAGAGAPPRARLEDGSLELIQSAPSASWDPLERGESSEIVHFAQINQRDGFFIAGRRPDPDFTWRKLEGAGVLADHGGQPLAMLKYALHKQGVDYASLNAIDAGAPDAMVAAFRQGQGDYIHLQGPAPQQLEQDGVAHVLAAVGEAIGPVAFSSLARHPRLARERHGQGVHARLREIQELGRERAARGGRQGRGAVLRRRRRDGAGAHHREPTSASAAGRGRSRSPATPTRSRSMCSSTAA